MTSQFNYLIVQQTQAELASQAEAALPASEARPAQPASAPRWDSTPAGGLCAHGMNSLTDADYALALGRLRRG